MPVRDPIDVKFGTDEMKCLEEFIFNNLTSLKSSLSELHENKLPKWRRLYKGIPAEEQRDFPWPNASNLVVQLIGENVDILKARIIGSIYEIDPLWAMGLVGEWAEQEQGEEQQTAMQAFMNLMGLEPTELDLYRVESLAANDMVQLGTVVIKTPWETEIEKLVTGDGIDRGAPATTELVKYDGPRPEKLALEDWGATVTAPTLEKAKFKFHKYRLFKDQLEEKIHLGLFHSDDPDTQAKIKTLCESPDNTGVDTLTQQKLSDQNINAPNPTNELATWDIYECWFTYWHNHAKYRIICPYHMGKRLMLRPIYNFYPDNDEPFEMGRLGYTDDGLYGYGLAEMLEHYQEEVSTGHNQRVDNRTLANTSVVLAGKNSKIDAGFSLYPMAVLPFDPSEVEIKQLGSNYPSSVPEEELTIALAKARSGVEPPTGGSGSGVTNPKKGGNFSAMGTFAVMQTGNRRININVTDFRYMHLKIGRKVLKQYADFGIGKRGPKFGAQEQYIKMALANIKKGRLDLPIRAATASVNSEVEKQNGMLFTQVMQRHYSSIASILQGIQNPTMPPDLKEFLIGSISGMGQLMSRLLKLFGYDDISRLQPELKIVKQLRSGQNGNEQQGVPQAAAPNNPNGQNLPAFPEIGQTQGTS